MRQMPLTVGQVVADRYRVERILGQGGMGVVVAARHLDLDEVFALKVMTAEAFESPESVERFVREARTTAKLKSVHAVKVVDSGRLRDGAPFLAMEYLQGRDLEKELAARGPLPPSEAAGYVMQACDVLAEAHGLGIVHRDLKPANLFLTRLPNGSSCVKVLDFGIAKQSDQLAGPRMTQTSSVFGTPLYMSPEQMKSSKSADPRSDLWSLGVVLYELCTGAVPYDGESMTALVAIVMTELPVPPSRRRHGISPEVEAVIMRCLQRDPAYRYQTAAALAQALAPIAQGYRPAQQSFHEASWGPQPQAAPSVPNAASWGPQPHAAAPSVPSWGTVPSQPAIVPAGVQGTTAPTWHNAGTQSALTTNTGAPPRSSTPIVLGIAAAIALGGALTTFFVLRGRSDASANAAPPGPTATATAPASAPTAAEVVPAPATATATAEVVPAPATAPSSAASSAASTTTAAPSASSTRPSGGSPKPTATTTATTSKTATKPTKPPPAGHGGFL